MSIMKKRVISFSVAIGLLVIAMIYSAMTGSIEVSVWEFIHGLWTGTNEDVQVIKDLRLPRIIIAIFAGAMLSVSGALLQAVVRNPLADPGIIGVSSGASFMSILVFSLFHSFFFIIHLFFFIFCVFLFFFLFSF